MAWLSNRVRHGIAALVAAVFLAGAPFSAWASVAHARPVEMPKPCHEAMDMSAGLGVHAEHGEADSPAMLVTAAICCSVIMPALLPFEGPAAVDRGWRPMPLAASDAPLAETEPQGLERPPRTALV